MMPALEVSADIQAAIDQFWTIRRSQFDRQHDAGRADAGARGAVTGGRQLGPLKELMANALLGAGIEVDDIHRDRSVELPGFYRSDKKWDLLAVANGQLLVALELKSHVGPSFGNNLNNRVEEAIGSATDLWVAFREGRLGDASPPFVGYFLLLEDCDPVRRPVRSRAPHFPVDPEFVDASYSTRYELLCRRLVRERLYQAACLTLATAGVPSTIHWPAADLSFARFTSALQAHVRANL
jgi:hypothetical protein